MYCQGLPYSKMRDSKTLEEVSKILVKNGYFHKIFDKRQISFYHIFQKLVSLTLLLFLIAVLN